ncbi:MAG: 50S ribosomal protein L9 [Tissierellia bacterium]|nr:50S ribosomal protein L9 [Tissierellia bacterium]
MKIILLKDVAKLGKEGDLVEVSDGYARNFLFPRKAALEATGENLEQWKEKKAQEEADEKENRAKALEIKKQLESNTLELKAKGGKAGRLFGAITSKDIAEGIKKQMGFSIDKRKIEMKENIKEAGMRTVAIRVYPEISADLKVNISIE